MLKNCSDTPSFAQQAKHRIKIQTQAETTDSYGGRSLVWNDTFTLWAIVTPVGTFENIQSKVLKSEVSHKVVIRYQADLANTAETAKYRMVLDDRQFSIIGIENIDKDMKNYGNDFQRLTVRDNGSVYA
jgi:SPP1 family predicted phage head-tail adaptor